LISKILLALLLISSISKAELFEKGNLGFGAIIGSGSITVGRSVQNYAIAGLSAEYFVIENLSVGLGYMGWFGATPSLNQLTIPVNYYVPLNQKYRPYFGAFVRETFVSTGYDDYTSYGAKGGLAYKMSRTSYLGIAIVGEFYGDNTIYKESSNYYPEITFAFLF